MAQPDADDADMLEAELFDLPLIAQQLGRRFVNRPWLQDRVEEALRDRRHKVVLVTGGPGTGKSTFMAWLATQQPDWLRYFIRRIGEDDGWSHPHDGGLSSFLTVVGLQLASRWRKLTDDLASVIDVYQRVGSVGSGGRTAGVILDEVVANPFRDMAMKFTVRVRQQVDGLTQGELTGAHIKRLILDVSQLPEALVGPAIGGPAARLAAIEPGKDLVILIDGLDELRFRTLAADLGEWLASVPMLPDNVRFVIASRSDEPRLAGLRDAYRNAIVTIDLDDEKDAQDVHQDIRRYVEVVAADPDISAILDAQGVHRDRFTRVISAKADGNFQYVAFLARALENEAFDAAVAPTWLSDTHLLPAGLDRLYALFLARVRSRLPAGDKGAFIWTGTYLPLLGMLAVARAALGQEQLAEFSRLSGGISGCQQAVAALRHFLNRDGADQYSLYHTSVAEFILGTDTDSTFADFHSDEATANARVVDTATTKHTAGGTWNAADPYLLRHLAEHATAVGRLAELADDPAFLVAAEPGGLLAAFAQGQAVPVARLYRQAVPTLRAEGEASALSHWELYARRVGMHDFAERVAQLPAVRTWQPQWAQQTSTVLRHELGQHDGDATCVTVADLDGKPMAASGGKDGTLRIWDLVHGTSAGQLSHATGPQAIAVTAVASGQLDSGEPMLVSGGADGAVNAWNLATRQALCPPLQRFENAGYPVAFGVCGGVNVIVCRASDYMRAWDLATQTPLGPPIHVPHAEKITVTAWPSGTLIAVGVNPGPSQERVLVFDAATGERVGHELRPDEGWVSGVAIAQAGETILVGVAGGGYGVRVWDLLAGEPRSDVILGMTPAECLALGVADGRHVLMIGDREGRVHLWDVEAVGWMSRPIVVTAGVHVTAVCVGQDSRLVCATAHRTGAQLHRLVVDSGKGPARTSQHTFATADEQLRSIAEATVDGREVLAGVDRNEVLQLWDPATGAQLAAVRGRHDKVYSVAVSKHDGRNIVIAGTGNVVQAWQLGSDGDSSVFGDIKDLPEGEYIRVARLQDREIVIGSTRHDGIHIWDLATGAPAGPGHIPRISNEYISDMAIGRIAGREVLTICTTSGNALVFDLLSGASLDLPHPRSKSWACAVGLLETARHTLLVTGSLDATIEVGNPIDPASQQVVHAVPDLHAMAVTVVGDQPVVIYTGRSGHVRMVDLTAGPSPASEVTSTAVGQIESRPVVFCGTTNGVDMIDARTGTMAAPKPTLLAGQQVTSVAATELDDGRVVGIAATPTHVLSWFAGTGEPTTMPAIERTQNSYYGTGRHLWPLTFDGRPATIVCGNDKAVAVHDLLTGEPLCSPFDAAGGTVTSVASLDVCGKPVAITATGIVVRARYLLTTAEQQEQDRALQDMHDRLQKGDLSSITAPPLGDEPPPFKPRIGENLSRPTTTIDVIDAGFIQGVPVLASGGVDGTIILHAIDSALPFGNRFAAHAAGTAVTAIKLGTINGAPFVVSGAADGTVSVWSPALRAQLAVIRALSRVTGLVLVDPDLIVIGTSSGLFAVRLILPAGLREWPVVLPDDVRPARSCPRHDQWTAAGQTARDGRPAIRFCIKGLQAGNPEFHSLRFPWGHLYLLADRAVLTEAGAPDWDLEAGHDVPVFNAYLKPQDSEFAYDHDGGHFRLLIDTAMAQLTLCFYRRSQRDEFLRILRSPGSRPEK